MHHVVLETWSRRSSAIHRIDPRAKIAALLVFLVVVGTAHRELPAVAAALLALLALTILSARLPLGRMMLRAGIVLFFAVLFGISSWLAGDAARAVAVVFKSYLSALAVLLVVSTTPMPALLNGLDASGVPRFLLMVTQFLYRYLFVISEEAQIMRIAAASRSSRIRFRAAASALAALFARSYARAEDIHRAMLARGFRGHFHTLAQPHFRVSDAAFLVIGSLAPVVLRAAVERVSG